MYGFWGSGASRSEIWSGVTMAGQTTNQPNKERQGYSANALWKAEMSNIHCSYRLTHPFFQSKTCKFQNLNKARKKMTACKKSISNCKTYAVSNSILNIIKVKQLPNSWGQQLDVEYHKNKTIAQQLGTTTGCNSATATGQPGPSGQFLQGGKNGRLMSFFSCPGQLNR